MSTLYSTSQHNDSLELRATFSAFCAFLEAERAALAQALAYEIAERFQRYRVLPPEEHQQHIQDSVGAYISALNSPAQFEDWIEHQMSFVSPQKIELGMLLEVIALYRQHFLRVALRALDAGVTGASDGLSSLMTLIDTAIRVVTQSFQKRDLKQQAAELGTFYALAENAPDGVLVARLDGVITYGNSAIRALLGYNQIPIDGVQIIDHLDAQSEMLEEIGQQIATNGAWRGMLSYRQRDGNTVHCQTSSFLIKSGDDTGVIASIVQDLTAQQRAEQERSELQEQVISAQQAALRELRTPLIPLADGVVAMPLIGTIDSARAQQVVQELLAGVAANRATTAIIDITGVLVVDTQVAGALLRAAQAVELLGARVVITGIRPEVAQTLVGIGVNLGSIVTRSTLQDGITYALRTR
jgi:PAS domain S-box-containing protein